MDSLIKLYLERAENELDLAKIIFELTESKNIQEETFHVNKVQSFYSAVITHSYYCIFYSAKAYLLKNSIKTEPPEEHRKTFEEFRILTEKGILDVELLKLYEQVFIRADTLLSIFQTEKNKRGHYTYQKLSQANHDPAKESLDNSKLFFRNIFNLCKEIQ